MLQKIKYLELNLTKALTTEMEKDTSKWKHTLSSWIGRINIVKMSIVSKAIYRFNTAPTKIPLAYFTEQEQMFQKII